MKRPRTEPLRVALVAGELTQGGAEKQLVYLARALRAANVDVKVFCLTVGEFHEHTLLQSGLDSVWFGRSRRRLVRAWSLAQRVRTFRPHVVQAIHSFTNPYAAIAARLAGALSIGGLRSDLADCSRSWVFPPKLLLSVTDGLIVNSNKAVREILGLGLVSRPRLYMLRNVIEVEPAASVEPALQPPAGGILCVGSLLPAKRVDLFLHAVASARQLEPGIRAVIAGDGPERGALVELSKALSLSTAVDFLGARADIGVLLKKAQMLVLCSEREGCPNVVLEAMAAGVSVISTPAGDVPEIVEDGVSGYVAPHGDSANIARSILRLWRCPQLCTAMGVAGQRFVRDHYSQSGLCDRLLAIYESIASYSRMDQIAGVIRAAMVNRPSEVLTTA